MYFKSEKGILGSNFVGVWRDPNWEQVAKGPDQILCIDYLRKGYWQAFGIILLEMEDFKQLSTFLRSWKDPFIVQLWKEQQVLIAATTVHWQ